MYVHTIYTYTTRSGGSVRRHEYLSFFCATAPAHGVGCIAFVVVTVATVRFNFPDSQGKQRKSVCINQAAVQECMLSVFYHPSLSIRSIPEAGALWRPVKKKRESRSSQRSKAYSWLSCTRGRGKEGPRRMMLLQNKKIARSKLAQFNGVLQNEARRSIFARALLTTGDSALAAHELRLALRHILMGSSKPPIVLPQLRWLRGQGIQGIQNKYSSICLLQLPWRYRTCRNQC